MLPFLSYIFSEGVSESRGRVKQIQTKETLPAASAVGTIASLAPIILDKGRSLCNSARTLPAGKA
jgi:hypothetical protein